MRDKLAWFGYGVVAGILLAGSTVGAVADNIEGHLKKYMYKFSDWRRERDIKSRQNPK